MEQNYARYIYVLEVTHESRKGLRGLFDRIMDVKNNFVMIRKMKIAINSKNEEELSRKADEMFVKDLLKRGIQ